MTSITYTLPLMDRLIISINSMHIPIDLNLGTVLDPISSFRKAKSWLKEKAKQKLSTFTIKSLTLKKNNHLLFGFLGEYYIVNFEEHKIILRGKDAELALNYWIKLQRVLNSLKKLEAFVNIPNSLTYHIRNRSINRRPIFLDKPDEDNFYLYGKFKDTNNKKYKSRLDRIDSVSEQELTSIEERFSNRYCWGDGLNDYLQ